MIINDFVTNNIIFKLLKGAKINVFFERQQFFCFGENNFYPFALKYKPYSIMSP